LGPKEIPLVVSGGANEFCLLIGKGKFESTVILIGNGKSSYKRFLVFLTDLGHKAGASKINGVVEGVKDPQREAVVFAAGDRKVVFSRAHGL
jgi:hypothetical protein